MNNQSVPINRPLVGIITVACFVAAGVIWQFRLDAENQMWLAGFVRVGLLMGAFWLALPSKGRTAAWANVSPWTLAGILLAIFTVVRFPRTIVPLVLSLGLIGIFLRPKQRARRP